ncbi:valine--tRNA ligase [Patescibacteria group bacterium]|nr:valine--tRNA ligase [Patescibacteria group bacterium]
MQKKYIPQEFEKEIYQLWEKSDFFNPDKLPGTRKNKYCVTIPPPNVTGSLHMGHALNNTIQDILIRYHRMQGDKTLWLPGTDHAGIATQNVVEKKLAQEGLSRHQLGREKFTEKVWEWKKEYGDIILKQLKKLGYSCDWSRLRFTLDQQYAQAVLKAFIHYHQKGYIYRGPRIVNWCPRCETAISDIEIKYQERKGRLWYIKYPLKNNPKKFITIATTRPETMLGDTAIAVNPRDKKYKELINQKAIVPLVEREIPIIKHHLVKSDFGTGALKITPAHDQTDWQIGKDHQLPVINVIGPQGKMTKEAGIYADLSALEAREKIIEELTKKELLVKTEEYQHQISLCDRCSSPIEPQISTQWFVKMKELAQPAIKSVQENKIKIIPSRYKKIYLNWMENIEDWCISRQLWWGHQLPVWFCQNQKEKYIVAAEAPQACPYCQKCKMQQSADVLDTWFSSALWPFATLGWPQKTKDLQEYYPTSLLSTARDILYLWVARMIFSGFEFLEDIPFKKVYIHGTILTIDGKRMSKSLKTGIDPLNFVEKYGADATRLGIILQANRDQQEIRFDERTILAARNFINKLWNISRFVEMMDPSNSENKKIKKPTIADQWILSRLNNLIKEVGPQIENNNLSSAAKDIYEFVWHDFADWYLEISKFQKENSSLEAQTYAILRLVLKECLKMLHPFIPFVTETINLQLNEIKKKDYARLLIIAPWPEVEFSQINKTTEKKFTELKELVSEIRKWRKEKEINPKEIVSLPSQFQKSFASFSGEEKKIIQNLAKLQ